MEESSEWLVMLLAAGPAGAAAFYWYIYRFYRNTDKSHAFERETAVDFEVTASEDNKIGTNNRTKQQRINGDNISKFRQRVRRLRRQ